jgi:hypothetical protein
MKKSTILLAVLTLVGASILGAENPAFPERLKTLTANYEAAIARASEPLTRTYLNELNKMKLEYTRAGDLQSALLVENLIIKYSNEASKSRSNADLPLPQTLARMDISQFKSWLAEVEIVQGDGLLIEYDGLTVVVTDPKTARPLPFDAAIVEIGKITIPYSKGASTVDIDNRLKTATITYGNSQFDATIRPKKDK